MATPSAVTFVRLHAVAIGMQTILRHYQPHLSIAIIATHYIACGDAFQPTAKPFACKNNQIDKPKPL